MPITKSTGTWKYFDKSGAIFESNPVAYKSTAYCWNKVDLYLIKTAGVLVKSTKEKSFLKVLKLSRHVNAGIKHGVHLRTAIFCHEIDF